MHKGFTVIAGLLALVVLGEMVTASATNRRTHPAVSAPSIDADTITFSAVLSPSKGEMMLPSEMGEVIEEGIRRVKTGEVQAGPNIRKMQFQYAVQRSGKGAVDIGNVTVPIEAAYAVSLTKQHPLFFLNLVTIIGEERGPEYGVIDNFCGASLRVGQGDQFCKTLQEQND